MAAPAFAADYQVGLGPMPLDDETKQVIAGRGAATATSDGKTLTVTGDFHGLPSNATAAHVFLSPVTGVPGKQVADLDVTKSTSGTISGNVKLNSAAGDGAAHRPSLYPDRQRESARTTCPGAPRARCGAGFSRRMKPWARTCRSKTTGSFPSSTRRRAEPTNA